MALIRLRLIFILCVQVVFHVILSIIINIIRVGWTYRFLGRQRLLPNSDSIPVRSLLLTGELASWVLGLLLL